MKAIAVDHLNAEAASALFVRAAENLLQDPLRTGCCVTLPARGRLLATGDLHDHSMHFHKVYAFAQLHRPDHHVILHELIHGDRLIHGVDLSWRMLAKAAVLRLQYPGQVHPMLANHEIAQAFDQQVSKGAGENTQLFQDGLDWSFGEDAQRVGAALRTFIRAMPLAVRAQNGLLCSHSLPSALALKQFDYGLLDRELVEQDFQPRTGAAWNMTWGRGHTEASIEQLASAWNVRLFIAGHQHVPFGVEAPFSRLLLLNSDHEHAMMLPCDLSQPAPTAQDAMLHAVPLGAIGEMVDG